MRDGRVTVLRGGAVSDGAVFYWMSRDQRVNDNWALLYAQEQAMARRAPLHVVFCLARGYLGAAWRQDHFMLRGLRQVEDALLRLAIPFHILLGEAPAVLPGFLLGAGCGLLVTDLSPLRIKRHWTKEVLARTGAPVHEVDAHNIVPCRAASDKQEWAAYTLRPKLRRQLSAYLDEFTALVPHPHAPVIPGTAVDWAAPDDWVTGDRSVKPVQWLEPGEAAASAALEDFVAERLWGYALRRNDPNAAGQSDLSPYLHFGQLSAQRVALAVSAAPAPEDDKEAFLEELIVRRELADNWCLYNEQYDTPAGFPAWARETLLLHQADPRPNLYDRRELEAAGTHDPLWNAAQNEMACRGKMHGYLRMYWAKKILEWTPDAAEAMATAIYLNDRYELDGRDPSGYAGIAWSIGGVHDRAWFSRPVFGKVRTMTLGGARGKFDVDEYVGRWGGERGQPAAITPG